MRIIRWHLLLLLLFSLPVGPAAAQTAAAPAAAEPRLALVIGNGAYKEQALRNPPNDARAMSASLRKVGFTVIERIDAGRRSMEEAVLEFGEKLKEGGIGLFYYAGHGMQVRGVNYLIPVDAAITSEASVRVQALDIGLVLDLMTDARNRANVVILDSCRNNPFAAANRGAKGLAAIDAARGTMIAYSTSPGAVAVDGDGENSPYTASLVKTMEEPGLKIEELFKRVRTRVVDTTQGLQTPWESSSLTGDLVFNVTVTVNPPAAPASPPPPPGRDPADIAFWTSIQASNNPRDVQEYLRLFPAGTFSGLAKRRLDEVSRRSTRLPTQQALAGAVDPGKRPATAAELLDRTYAGVMGSILPRSRYSEGPNAGKPFVYREAGRDKAMAVCMNWKDLVDRTYGSAPPAADAGIVGWRAAISRPGVANAREDALATCWMLYAGKECRCEIFDENDRNALKLPEAVEAAVVARPAPPPVAIEPAKKRATAAELVERTYADAMRHILPRSRWDAGPNQGKPYLYREAAGNKAMAICMNWDEHVARTYGTTPAVDGAGIKGWRSAESQPTAEKARETALQRCRTHDEPRGCSCTLFDENDRNVLRLPESVMSKLVEPAPAAATASAVGTSSSRETLRAAMHKVILDKIMSTPAEAGPAIGKPGGIYAQDPADRALAACIFWGPSTRQNVSLGTWASGKNADPDRRRHSAVDTCNKAKGTKTCTCQLIDEGGSNLLELPDEFVARVQAKPAG